MATVTERRTRHLARANEIRLDRSKLHREVKQLDGDAGMERVAELLLDPPESITSMPAFDLLQWPRRTGHQAARKFWFGVAAPPWRENIELRELTDRQRRLLAKAVLRRLEAKRRARR